MPHRRKIIVWISTSADGFIARPDGDVAWLDRPRPKGNYGMGKFYKSINTILWGRKTYSKGIEMGMRASWFPPGSKNYVFTRQPASFLAGGGAAAKGPALGVHFEFVTEPVETFAQRLRAEREKDIWMMGGAGIIASFLDAAEIDEFLIHVVPVFIGEGIPLMAPRPPEARGGTERAICVPTAVSGIPTRRDRLIRLQLLACKPFPDGVVRVHYVVRPSS